jgi:WD40 repeat protein
MPVIIHRLRQVLVPLLLLLPPSVRGENPDYHPVSIVPDRVVFERDTRAVFAASAARLIVTDSDGTYVWDVASGRLVRRIIYEAFAKTHVLTPDEETMISGHMDGKIRLWSLATAALAGSMQEKKVRDEVDEITALAITPDGALLVSGTTTGVISVWNVKTREKLRSFNFAADPEPINPKVIALRVTKDLKNVIAASRDSVRSFDFGSGARMMIHDLPREKDKSENSLFRDSLVSDDGLIAQHTGAGCDVAELRYIDLKDPSRPLVVDAPANCHRGEQDAYDRGEPALFASPVGSTLLIARSGVGEIREWNLKTRSPTRTIQWTSDATSAAIGVDKDLARIASNGDHSLSIRDLESGASVATFDLRVYPADAVLSKDGNAILFAQQTSDNSQQQLTLWEIGAADPKKILRVPGDTDTTIRDFSLEAKLVAATTKEDFVLLSLETGEVVHRFVAPQIKSPWNMRLSPDGKLALLLGDGADNETVALLIDTSNGSVKRSFDEKGPKQASKDDDSFDQTAVTDAAFSPDGKWLALGRFNQTIDLFDTASLKRIKQLPGLGGDDADRVWFLRFTPDGKKLISGSRDSGAFLWNVNAGRPPRAFLYDDMVAMHPHLGSVALSHDGSKLIAGSGQHAISSGDSGRERSIKVWNAGNGKRLSGWVAHESSVLVVTFSPDDRWIISASHDGTIKYWDAETGKVVATIMVSNDGHWAVLSPSGLFSGNAGDTNFFNLSRGYAARPLSDVRGELYRPELIESLLKGDREHRYAAAARALDLKKVWDGLRR